MVIGLRVCVRALCQLNKILVNISMWYSFCSLFCRYCKFSLTFCNIHDKAFTSIYARMSFVTAALVYSELFCVYISMRLALIAVCASYVQLWQRFRLS